MVQNKVGPAEFVRHSQISLDSGVVHDVDPLAVHMAEQKKHNVLFIMADDIGWFNVSAYNLGVMGFAFPISTGSQREGALFTDFYGQQSCTAGRQNRKFR